MVQGIIIPVKPAWYCKKCEDSHRILYLDGDIYYCEKCVPPQIKDQAVYMNQNREPIEYKEI